MRVLLVEDDVDLSDALVEALTEQRYIVDAVYDGEAGWAATQVMDYDLIVLDVMLPKLDGISLCQRLRSHNYSSPILMITARDTSADKVAGLDAGADDYVVKPVDLAELSARVRALLRRGNTASSPILEWDGLKLNPSTYEVTYNNQLLHLTPKEYSILELFLRSGRRVLSRSLLIEHAWSLEAPPSEDTVKAHIKSLRNKLKVAGAPNNLIETIHGLGYRLNPNS
ncbi:MAG TPA: response regulator transcription factor [Waterburya sp.]|jgi:DNA-binding response OmpR family regulator